MNSTCSTTNVYSLPNLARTGVTPAYLGLIVTGNRWPRRPQRQHRPPASTLLELTREHAHREQTNTLDRWVQSVIFGVSAAALGYSLRSLVQFVSRTPGF